MTSLEEQTSKGTPTDLDIEELQVEQETALITQCTLPSCYSLCASTVHDTDLYLSKTQLWHRFRL